MLTKAEIAFIRSLSSRRERAASGLFVAEGEKSVREMLASSFPVRRVLAVGDGAEWLPLRADTELVRVSPKEMERISMLKTPAGVLAPRDMERLSLLKTPSNSLALVEIPRCDLKPERLRGRLTLALDDVQNPGNLGTIVRLADWFGIRDIVCSEATADCFNPKVVQATMGAITRVRVHYLPLSGLLEKALSDGIPVYGTFLDGDDIYGAELSADGILVMGNEGKGIGPDVEKCVSRRLYIPSYPGGTATSESLNVAVATAVACAEFRRRLR